MARDGVANGAGVGVAEATGLGVAVVAGAKVRGAGVGDKEAVEDEL